MTFDDSDWKSLLEKTFHGLFYTYVISLELICLVVSMINDLKVVLKHLWLATYTKVRQFAFPEIQM